MYHIRSTIYIYNVICAERDRERDRDLCLFLKAKLIERVLLQQRRQSQMHQEPSSQQTRRMRFHLKPSV